MGPHAQDADDAFLFEHLIDEPVLNTNSARVHPRKVAHEALVARKRRERILCQDLAEALSFRLEAAGRLSAIPGIPCR